MRNYIIETSSDKSLKLTTRKTFTVRLSHSGVIKVEWKKHNRCYDFHVHILLQTATELSLYLFKCVNIWNNTERKKTACLFSVNLEIFTQFETIELCILLQYIVAHAATLLNKEINHGLGLHWYSFLLCELKQITIYSSFGNTHGVFSIGIFFVRSLIIYNPNHLDETFPIDELNFKANRGILAGFVLNADYLSQKMHSESFYICYHFSVQSPDYIRIVGTALVCIFSTLWNLPVKFNFIRNTNIFL